MTMADSNPQSDLSSYPNPYALPQIPRFVLDTSGVSNVPDREPIKTKGSTTLPLNLVALIVSHLDDIADIARVTRTSRLLYYMTLPQLYQKVSLRSYSEIRYVNGRPEGFGSGSPFMMALNGLVTKNHAALVEELRLWGGWKELGQEDFAKGRVPENSMMLNILLRSATDKMSKLRTFSWELSTKPLETLYQGLATHTTLAHLTIRFPSSRVPRPAVVIPPIPSLHTFRALDIDPLCYPDDISLLPHASPRLRDLRLHFSPRMRREAEPSLSLETYFGRCSAANYKLPIRHFAMQNFYGSNSTTSTSVWDNDTIASVSFIDVFGGLFGSASTIFYDAQWRNVDARSHANWKACRSNELAPQHIELIAQNPGLERVFFISTRRPRAPASSPSSTSPVALTPSTSSPSPPTPDPASTSLCQAYLSALQTSPSTNLTHLLFPDLWPLNRPQISALLTACPNLQQLGFPTRLPLQETLPLVLRALLSLRALRFLEPAGDEVGSLDESVGVRGLEAVLASVGKGAVGFALRWLGVGGAVFKVRALGTRGWSVEAVERDEVATVEVWGLDCMDIMEEAGAGVWEAG
ncbi:hypothetical protein MBLNU230_g4508t1 [Neophaeotheca triangularis]